ncbi:SIMPL domain-containing protein [Paraferrimonas sedimenticola]|uniref:Oxidative stress defense protein n=1 Tax=Paraferrimonas sedimenticola TaxID=375674 RepID=A0AA37RQS0_9GAMM|nr:SIMPL domain-containing protein [Paraferrimonas sedimenticola]GLP95120.1 hypothetical protein GCM10007895_04260 [Paraferrimonas sedimenticola]
MIKQLVAVVLGVCVLSVTSVGAKAMELPNFPFVIGNGEAERQVKPDMAKIHLSLRGNHADSEVAATRVNNALEQVLVAVKRHGLDESVIEATDLQKNAQWRRAGDSKPTEIIGYSVSREVTLHLDNLDKYASLMSDLVVINHMARSHSSFDVSNREQIKAELEQEAGKKAREKANRLASSLGAKVVSIYAVGEGRAFDSLMASFGPNPDYSPRRDYALASSAESHDNTPMFIPKSLPVSAAVSAVFKIE